MPLKEQGEFDTWGGRPIARRISEAVPRGRVIVSGVIRTAVAKASHGSASYVCTLDDGTGELGLVFLGRRHVAGLVAGERCTVEGTAMMDGGRLLVWNPRYRFEQSGL